MVYVAKHREKDPLATYELKQFRTCSLSGSADVGVHVWISILTAKETPKAFFFYYCRFSLSKSLV